MKNAIKVLCFTLAVIIVGTSAFLYYFKWGKTDFEYIDGTDKGTVIITSYSGDSKNIIIPDRIRGKKVQQIDSMAFAETDITSVTIGDNVTYLGKSAFRSCKSLKSVELGKSLLSIDEACFMGCSALESVVLPESVETLGSSVFANCSALKSVEFESDKNFVIRDGVIFTSDMKTIIGALQYEDFGNYVCPDTVTSIQPFSFYGCKTLTGFTFSKNMIAIPQGLFVFCTGLKELTVPDNITQIGSAVTTESGVKKITIPSSVKVIDKAAFINSDGKAASDFVIRTTAGSKAETFAKENSIKTEIIK